MFDAFGFSYFTSLNILKLLGTRGVTYLPKK